MKTEDLNRLKEICEKEGVDVSIVAHATDGRVFFEISQKPDEWEGVEFAECILNSESFTVGNIYKIKGKNTCRISFVSDDFGMFNGQDKDYFKPSTEEAYVNQLKSEAFERFGEIKDGEKFKRPWLTGLNEPIGVINTTNFGWDYWKNHDNLNFGGICIYQKGQWAEKIEVPKVEYQGWENGLGGTKFSFAFNDRGFHLEEIGKHLSKCLQEYLNQNRS